MKAITLQISDSVAEALELEAQTAKKSIEQVILDKIINQLKKEQEDQLKNTVLALLQESEIMLPSKSDFTPLLTDSRETRETIFDRLLERKLGCHHGKPLHYLVIIFFPHSFNLIPLQNQHKPPLKQPIIQFPLINHTINLPKQRDMFAKQRDSYRSEHTAAAKIIFVNGNVSGFFMNLVEGPGVAAAEFYSRSFAREEGQVRQGCTTNSGNRDPILKGFVVQLSRFFRIFGFGNHVI